MVSFLVPPETLASLRISLKTSSGRSKSCNGPGLFITSVHSCSFPFKSSDILLLGVVEELDLSREIACEDCCDTVLDCETSSHCWEEGVLWLAVVSPLTGSFEQVI